MKFMHLADLHLDSPFIGISKHLSHLHHNFVNAPYLAFKRAVDYAIEAQLDFIVIAGDVYDAAHQTIYAQSYLVREFERLNEAGIPVVMIHGNHDYLNPSKYQVHYPENVHEFTEQEVTHYDLTLQNGESVRFYGFSYNEQWITEDMVAEYPQNPRETDWTIGLLHGDVKRGENNHYAPFEVQDMADKNYDYWALGHIHQVLELHEAPTILYSGTPQGRHHNEMGDRGGYVIELKEQGQIEKEFISLAEIVWQDVDVFCHAEDQASDIVKSVEEAMANFQTEQQATQQSYILTVTLRDSDLLSPQLQEQIEKNELMQALEVRFTDHLFVAIRKVIMASDIEGIRFDYDPALNESFQRITEQMHEDEHYQQVMGDVFNHAVMRRWLPEMKDDPAIKEEVIETAKQSLNQQFSLAFEVIEDED